jgi:hypothetical protein
MFAVQCGGQLPWAHAEVVGCTLDPRLILAGNRVTGRVEEDLGCSTQRDPRAEAGEAILTMRHSAPPLMD